MVMVSILTLGCLIVKIVVAKRIVKSSILFTYVQNISLTYVTPCALQSFMSHSRQTFIAYHFKSSLYLLCCSLSETALACLYCRNTYELWNWEPSKDSETSIQLYNHHRISISSFHAYNDLIKNWIIPQ